jgi:hypothetical protein
MKMTAADPFAQLFTVKQVASLLRDPPYTTGWIRRLCINHDVGRVVGRDRLLAEDDLRRLRTIINPPENLA